MDQKTYDRTTEREFRGRRVRSLVELKNGWGSLPAGKILTIEKKFNGFNLISDPCPTCGFRLSISRVKPRQIELLE